MKKLLACMCVLLVGVSVASAGTVYALDLRANPNNLIAFPVNAPAPNIVAPVSIDSYAMDFDSMATTLYAVNVASPFAIGTLNTGSGAYTSIATISGLNSADSITGLSCDPITNTFYLSTNQSGVGGMLYTLNVATGAATFVAPMGTSAELFIDIAIGPTGQMYAHDIASDSLFSVNKATGLATLIDSKQRIRERYDLQPGTSYLLRPDQHVAARWRQFDADKVRVALACATGNA